MTPNNFVRLLFFALLVALPTRPALAADALEHREVEVTTSEGFVLHGWITRPAGTAHPLPSLFLTQWVACGSVAPRDGDLQGRLSLAANYAVVRIDRAGTGKSTGPGCDKLDYETEVRHYREAFDQILHDPWIDPARVVVYGSSLGATTAPLVAQGKPVAGLLVQGGGALTYLERMIRFDRNQLERQANFDPASIDGEMRRRIAFQRLYLEQKLTPEEIELRHPELAGVWSSMFGTVSEPPHYGRSHAWHWQAADQDWLAAWAALDTPVMVVYGEYDQFEGRAGHRAIHDTVERLRPGTASWLEIPRAGHSLRIYPDIVSAYAWTGGETRPELFVVPVTQWLREIAGKP